MSIHPSFPVHPLFPGPCQWWSVPLLVLVSLVRCCGDSTQRTQASGCCYGAPSSRSYVLPAWNPLTASSASVSVVPRRPDSCSWSDLRGRRNASSPSPSNLLPLVVVFVLLHFVSCSSSSSAPLVLVLVLFVSPPAQRCRSSSSSSSHSSPSLARRDVALPPSPQAQRLSSPLSQMAVSSSLARRQFFCFTPS